MLISFPFTFRFARRIRPARIAIIGALSGLCLLQSGCGTTSPSGERSHAALTIKHHGSDEIRRAAREVFTREGYTVSHTAVDTLEFRRPGSALDRARYGDWMTDGVSIIAKLKITPAAADEYLLQLNMFSLGESKDSFFVEERRIVSLNNSAYRKLLGEIEKQLAAPPE